MKPLRIHLLGLPNAPVHEDWSLDGFAQATHRFARMMKSLGHTVYLYAAEGSNAPCDEMIQIISERERASLLTGCEYQHAAMDERYPIFQRSNAAAAAEIAYRKQPGDFLLSVGGLSQGPVFDYHKDLLGVEYSIGYTGNFAKHRVFESYAWMHYCYGLQNIVDGRFFDTVIPMFFDPEHFEFAPKSDDYVLYVGRIIERKGISVVCQAATAAGVKLLIVGHGGDKNLITGGHEYLGAVDWKTRNDLMAHARAVITPTIYIEPFNCVAVEAQMCGTPVISTDWGGFTETIEQGRTGFRCAYLGEFMRAIENCGSLDRKYIAQRAVQNYSMHVLKHEYERYFRKLQLLWGAGWNTLD